VRAILIAASSSSKPTGVISLPPRWGSLGTRVLVSRSLRPLAIDWRRFAAGVEGEGPRFVGFDEGRWISSRILCTVCHTGLC
jgi:hypothetical protein